MVSQKSTPMILGGVIFIVILAGIIFANYWVNQEIEKTSVREKVIVAVHHANQPVDDKKVINLADPVENKENVEKKEVLLKKDQAEPMAKQNPPKKIYEIPLDDLILVQ